MCCAPLHHIPPRTYRCSAEAKPCAGRISRLSPRRRADGTPPRSFAGSELGVRHRAERVPRTRRCQSNGAWIGPIVKTYDYINRVDITLPLSVYEGTYTTLSPLVAMHHHDLACA